MTRMQGGRRWIRRFVSDRRKVMATVLLFTVATIAVIGFVTVRATHNRLIARTDESLRSQLTTAQNAMKVLTPQQLATLAKVPNVFADGGVVVVLDANGKQIFVTNPRPNGAQPVVHPTDIPADEDDAFTVEAPNGVTYRAVAGDIGQRSTIVYMTPLTAVDQTVHDLAVTVIVIGGIGALVLAVLLWRLLTAASKPVDEMIGVATQIGQGDLSVRLDDRDLRGEAGRLGSALNQMVGRLEQSAAANSEADARLRQFVADASHELRTPLANIRGYAQLIRIGASDDPDVAVHRIEDETIRMSALVDDLLLLARFDQGRVSPREPLDLVDLVRAIVGDAHVLEPARPLSFETAVDDATVLGSADELRKVFTNLLANVRVHAPVDAPCTVRLDATAAAVMVTVSDRGPGMPVGDTTKAFDRFYRSDASRTRDSGGSGLGLSISKAIVTAHGGTIDLTSEVGVGTTVVVLLPRATVARPQPAEPAPV